jgi:hypothetical protein
MSATELTGAAIVAQHLADVRTAAELGYELEPTPTGATLSPSTSTGAPA